MVKLTSAQKQVVSILITNPDWIIMYGHEYGNKSNWYYFYCDTRSDRVVEKINRRVIESLVAKKVLEHTSSTSENLILNSQIRKGGLYGTNSINRNSR